MSASKVGSSTFSQRCKLIWGTVLWLSLIYMPMLIRIQWVILILSMIVLFFGAMAGAAATTLKTPSHVDERQSNASQTELFSKHRHNLASLALNLGSVLFVTEAIIVARIMGNNSQSWLLLRVTISYFRDLLSVLLPALSKLPAAMIAEGFQDRIDIVADVYTIAYISSFAVILILTFHSGKFLLDTWRYRGYLQMENPLDIKGRLQGILGLLASPFMFAITIYMIYFETGVKSLPGRKEVFPHFEMQDIDLAYRATTVPSIGASSLVLIPFFVALITMWYVGRRFHERAPPPDFLTPPQDSLSRTSADDLRPV